MKINEKLSPYLNILLSILFLFFPLIISLILLYFNYKFSYVGLDKQVFSYEASYLIFIGLLTSLFSGFIFYFIISKFSFNTFIFFRHSSTPILLLSVISYFGVLYSFGFTFLNSDYSGPKFVFLNIGGWNILLLITLTCLINFLNKYNIILVVIILTLIMLPLLLSGSRIDYLSLTLPFIIYNYIIKSEKFFIKNIFNITALIFIFFVLTIVNNLRYKDSRDISYTNSPIGIVHNYSEVKSPSSINKYSAPSPSSNIYYMSTLGDVAASFYQIYWLIESNKLGFEGSSIAFNNYAIRLIPGIFKGDRPGDFPSQPQSEAIGGGAMHAIAEFYLISGKFGIIFISIVYGIFFAVGSFFLIQYKTTKNMFDWLIFSFTWIIIIRSGWYQAFALFKALEVILVLLSVLYINERLIRFLKKF